MKFNKTLILPIIAILLYYAGAGISHKIGYDKGVKDSFPTEWTCLKMDHIGSISSLDDKTKMSYFPEDSICTRRDKRNKGQLGIMYGTGEVRTLPQ